MLRGEFAGLQRWEPAIRALCSGREIYGVAAWETLVDRSGGPLDLLRRSSGPNLHVCKDRLDGPMVFIKNSKVVKGMGDLDVHIDSTLGGYPVMCPYIQLGIQLDHANPANRQLLVLAGSHRYVKHALAWGEEGDLPVIALETEPGDLTIHDGYAQHTTPPPTTDGAGRRALYYKFAEAKTFDLVPAGVHYFDALFQDRSEYRIAIAAITEDELHD